MLIDTQGGGGQVGPVEEEEEDQVGLVAGLLLYYDRYVVEFIQGLCDSRSPSLSNSLPPLVYL